MIGWVVWEDCIISLVFGLDISSFFLFDFFYLMMLLLSSLLIPCMYDYPLLFVS